LAYQLGIDLGTTYTAAAVVRDGRAHIVTLGNRAASIPSVVFLKEDETILTGDAASRRALSEPGRVAREFKRRLGDPTPLILGGAPYAPQTLMSKLLRWVVDLVSEREGGPPDHVAVTYPANWGPYKQDLLAQAIQMAGLASTTTLTEPEAAAIHYASQERVEPGAVVAVYDLGGGTFDAALLRKGEDGFQIVGRPEGIEHLGGIDFDQAVLAHIDRALDGALSALDPKDPASVQAMARLREDAVEAKEALSSDTDVTIQVVLPTMQTEVRLTRAELESMLRLPLSETIEALRRALRSAGVEPEDVTAVLLVGGSSRIPLVAQLVSAELGRPVAVDADPKHTIALGAALAAWGAAQPERGTAPVEAAAAVAAVEEPPSSPEPPPSPPAPEPTVPIAPMAATGAADGPPPPTTPPPTPGGGGTTPPEDGSRTRKILVGVIAAIVLVGAGTALALSLGGGDAGEEPTGSPTTSTEPTTPAETTTGPTTEPTTTTPPTTTAAPTGKLAEITSIVLEGSTYVVSYDTTNYTEELPGFHVHFFWNTVPPTEAGVPAPGSNWFVYGGPRPFQGWTTADRPADATQMCVLVARPDHSVIQDTGNCVELP
jgi:actin-like ATPase involved in cell morphogenesis